MHQDHQIEITDEVAFFKIHDLNNDGFWSQEEMQSLYGVERGIDPTENHIMSLIDSVFEEMDTNKDRYISLEEYLAHNLPAVSKEDEAKEQEIKKKKAKNVTSSTVKGQKVIVNNKRTPSPKRKGAEAAAKEKLFNQQGADEIPLKFRV